MSNCEPHGFMTDRLGRHPASFRHRRSPHDADLGQSGRSRSSFRISSLRSALFSGQQATNSPRGASVDKTPPSSGVLRSLFSRQVDSKSPSCGDLWVDVDLRQPVSPSLDDLADRMAVEETVSGRPGLLDRCSTADEGRVAIVRRSNSSRPATRRPLPLRVPVVPQRVQDGAPGPVGPSPAGPGAEMETDIDLMTRRVNSHNNARLSTDSGHVSCMY